jgi:hypothetical protein
MKVETREAVGLLLKYCTLIFFCRKMPILQLQPTAQLPDTFSSGQLSKLNANAVSMEQAQPQLPQPQPLQQPQPLLQL